MMRGGMGKIKKCLRIRTLYDKMFLAINASFSAI